MSHATPDWSRTHEWPDGARLLAVAVVLEAILLVTYLLGTSARVVVPRYVVYPFLWINVGLVAVARVDVPDASRRHSLLAAAIAGGYFLVLVNWSGLIGLTTAGHHGVPDSVLGLTIGTGSPGWQRVRLVTEVAYVSFVPYRAIGYVALTYLVYVAVLDATSAAFSGAIGLVSCLSCSFPIVAAAITSVWGGTATLMSTVFAYSVDVSTVTFLVSVALLYWRPGFPSLGEN